MSLTLATFNVTQLRRYNALRDIASLFGKVPDIILVQDSADSRISDLFSGYRLNSSGHYQKIKKPAKLSLAMLHLPGSHHDSALILAPNTYQTIFTKKLALLEAAVAKHPAIIAGDFNSVFLPDDIEKNLKYFATAVKKAPLDDFEKAQILSWNLLPFEFLQSYGYRMALGHPAAIATSNRSKTTVDFIFYNPAVVELKECVVLDVVDLQVMARNCHNPVIASFKLKNIKK
jgi:exonuclease III